MSATFVAIVTPVGIEARITWPPLACKQKERKMARHNEHEIFKYIKLSHSDSFHNICSTFGKVGRQPKEAQAFFFFFTNDNTYLVIDALAEMRYEFVAGILRL
jgi:hypothetical protein